MMIFEKIANIYAVSLYPSIKHIRGTTKMLHFLSKLATLDKEKISLSHYTVMDKKWDYLIVLDACRYDLFKEVTGLSGYIISVGSQTEEWVKNTFKKDFYNIIYISANPTISNYLLRKKILGKTPFFHLEEVWKYGWDEKLKTVPPDVVRKVALELVKKYPNKRMIIHFMQPHFPFIVGRKSIMVWEALKEGMDKEELWKAYKYNLILVWKEVKKLVKKLRGKVIVTSDHGNCFGEYGIYEHPPGIRVEELVKVPWVVLKDS